MTTSILDTGVKVVKNVGGFTVGRGSLAQLPIFVDSRRAVSGTTAKVVYLIDEFFRGQPETLRKLGNQAGDIVR
ncbi:MAG: hypothetical protein EBT27_10390, partial [Betaproteobacteria bacterium]|nr:hypothetical protein [Betaproteobacteria bacterium]